MQPRNRRLARRAPIAFGAALLLLTALAPASASPDAPRAASIEAPRGATAPADGTDAMRRSIASREYEATRTASGLQAPNRAHGLRTYFDGGGARVVDREDASRELARLRTVAVGREGALARAGGGTVRAEGARVEVRRPGVVEWYENSERGLEQGWTLDERPRGEGALAIEVDFGADVRVGAGAVTIASRGRSLEYGGLAARDATGAALAVRMERASSPNRARVVVDDDGATYPITVDPTLTQPSYATLAADQAGAAAGYSVAGAGDVNGDGYDDVVVGAYLYDAGQTDEGAAFVYLGGPDGIASGGPSSASARLESDQAGARMGSSVASAGDVNRDGFDDVLVGAPYYDSGQTNEGAAFVFLGGATGVASGNPATASARLEANQSSAFFGTGAAAAGDVNDDGFDDVVVGAPNYDLGQTDEGAAFVFLGGATGIASGGPATANTVLQSNQAASQFGASVASAGDTNGDGYDDVVVGAKFYDLPDTDSGAAFVFLGGAAGVGSAGPEGAHGTLYSGSVGTNLGVSVAGVGDFNGDGFDDVAVGALRDGSGALAFVFLGFPSAVVLAVPIRAGEDNSYGTVAGAGDVDGDGYDDLLVGVENYSGGQIGEGAALLYLGDSRLGASAPAAVLQPDQPGARMGLSVAGLGDVNGDGFDDVGAGAPGYDAAAGADEGAAFVYLGSVDVLSGFPAASASIVSSQDRALMGFAVAGAGDVNGDGFDDVVVGAQYYDGGSTDEGAAFVFHGGPSGVGSGDPSSADAVLFGGETGFLFGFDVAGAGDVNGDGYDDVVVGAGQPVFEIHEPEALVFHGGPAGVGNRAAADADAVLRGDENVLTLFGLSVDGAGDVNGDGYDDVIVGSADPSYGAAYVYYGGPSGVGSGGLENADNSLLGEPGFLFSSPNVAGAHDVNGDGFDDVVVTGKTVDGAAFVFLGGPSGVGNRHASEADLVLSSTQAGSRFGSSVAGAGDVNGDGYDDIIVGASASRPGETDGGAAFVFLGGPSTSLDGNEPTADTVLSPDDAGAVFGFSVGGAGDVNGDGYDDVVVGTTYSSPELSSAFVFLGGPDGVASGTPRTAAAKLGSFPAPRGFDSRSASVAGAGDVDGDGFDDVVVGAPYYVSPGTTESGAAFVFDLRRPAAPPAGTDTVGVYVPSSGVWFLRDANSPGPADAAFAYGAAASGFVALRGDWDGDGDDTPGLYVPATGAFFLRDTTTAGGANVVFSFGAAGAGYVPLSGDWDGDGTDTVGLYAPATSTFFLKNANAPGGADVAFGFGPPGSGWTPISGDWNGDGTDTIGLYSPSTGAVYLRNANAPGFADVSFAFGPPASGWTALAGDFDGNGTDTLGLYDPSSGTFFLKNANAAGAADLVVGFGPAGSVPLVGDWDGGSGRSRSATESPGARRSSSRLR